MVHFKNIWLEHKEEGKNRGIFQSPKTKAGIQIGKLGEDLGHMLRPGSGDKNFCNAC